MPDTKSFLTSKTIWGGLLAIAAPAIGILGYTITPADQAAIVAVATSLASAVGGALTIWGRIKATKRIG